MFLLYFKQDCPYSINALNLLTQYKLNFIKIDIDFDHPIRQQLLNEYNYRTIPVIFYYDNGNNEKDYTLNIDTSGTFIGGYDRLSKLFNILLSLNKNNIKNIKTIWTSCNKEECKMDYKTFLKIAIEFIDK